MGKLACFLIFCLALSFDSTSGDWPQFRGGNSAGVYDGVAPPVEFGPNKNLLWRLDIGAGHSSPCIVGGSIFLTTFNEGEKRLEVVRMHRADGRVLWRRTVPVDKIEQGHPSFSPASSTPACDGELVVAYFGSFGLICLDFEGTKQWEIKMPLARTYGGNAISPIITGERVILYRGTYEDHYVLAVDKRTGEVLWKTELHEKFTPDMSCTAPPIVAGDKLILHSARAVQAFDVATGAEIWQAKCSTTATSTPVLAEGKVLVATWNQTGEPALTPKFPDFDRLVKENDRDEDGLISKDELPRLMYFHRSEGTDAPQNGAPLHISHADKNKNGEIERGEWRKVLKNLDDRRERYVPHGLLAIDLNGRGLIDVDSIRNLENKGLPEVPSPLYFDGYVYFVKNGGILTCLELSSGKRVYRMRTKGTGTHYASPIIAGEKLYSTAGDGRISVLSLGPDPEILATNDLGDPVYATPAVVDGVLYVRSHNAVMAFKQE